MHNLMIPVLDGQAVAHAARLGKAMAAQGWDVDHEAVAAVVASAPPELQARLMGAIAEAYEAAAPAGQAAA